MSRINFLPESFERVRRRQQRRPVEFAVIGATAVMLVAMWLYTAGPDTALARQSDELDQRLLQIEQQQAEQARLEQERGRLTARLLIARETYQPILASQVIARLSELTPEPVQLANFELTAERPKPAAAPKPSANANKQVVASAGQEPAVKPREPNRMNIALTGLAPTDREVVLLIRGLEQDPVFSNVTLRSSRMTETPTHLAREFQLDVEIDLDRRFVPANQKHRGDHGAD